MKYVKQRQSSPITWGRNCRNTYRPDISISRPWKTGIRPGVSKAAAAGAGGAERRNRGCLPAGGIPGGAGDKYFLSVHAIRKIVYQK